MGLTYGAASSHRVTVANTLLALGPASSMLIACGWVYPTTLTATRQWWSCSPSGAGTGCRIHSTTSELEYAQNRGTTDATFNTNGLGLTVNKWRFIATFATISSGGALPATGPTVWASTDDLELVQLAACTQINAGSGAATSSPQVVLGNLTTASTGWQGYMGDLHILQAAGTVGAMHPFNISTAYGTAPTAAELNRIANDLIYPIMVGTRPQDVGWSSTQTTSGMVVVRSNDPSGCLQVLASSIKGLTTSEGIVTGATIGDDPPFRLRHLDEVFPGRMNPLLVSLV